MISYSRGDWHAVASRGAAAVFDPDLSINTIRAMWAALSADPGPGAVIQVLVGSFGSSLGSLPSFAVAFSDPGVDAVRVMVRGTARARLTRADGSVEEVGGLGVATWSERTVPGAVRVELAGFGEEPVGYPLVDGVAGAGKLVWDLEVSPGGESAAAEQEHLAAAEPTRAPTEPERAAAVPERVATEPRQAVATTELESAPAVQDCVLREPDPAAPPTPWAAVAPAPVTSDPVPRPEVGDTLPTLGQTFGAPLDRTFGEDGDDPDQDGSDNPDPDGSDNPDPDGSADPGAAPDPDDAYVRNPPVEEATTGYDHLLWGETRTQLVEAAAVRAEVPTGPAPTMITGIPAAATAPEASLGDHDGETVSAEQLLALQQRLAQAGAPNPGASPIPTDPALALFGMPQPGRAAAVLVVSSGERVVLDRAAVVGRRPRAVRATGLIPHLVTVDSPNQDVSRSHVELRVEGSDVVATDLNTTNGTRLLRVGAEPVRLHPGEATLLVTGDRLDLGDEIVLAFEGL